jgi:hypothetical protein
MGRRHLARGKQGFERNLVYNFDLSFIEFNSKRNDVDFFVWLWFLRLP